MRSKRFQQLRPTNRRASRPKYTSEIGTKLAPLFASKAAPVRALAARLYDRLDRVRSAVVDQAYRQWTQFAFSGCLSETLLARQAGALAKAWGVSTSDNARQLLFAAQTAYAMVVKLLAARSLPGWDRKFSPWAGLARAVGSCLEAGRCCALLEQLERLPVFGPVARCGESSGEYSYCEYESAGHSGTERSVFAWYLAAWNQALEEATRPVLQLVAQIPSEELAGCAAHGCDLPAELFGAFFPRTLRLLLGEYYTPGWLADHVLEQAGWPGTGDQRLLDPTCGSGTFLLRAIAALREPIEPDLQAGDHRARESLRRQIVAQVAGFDVSPVAVLAARANYLMAIADLALPEADISIPVDRLDILSREPPASDLDYQSDLAKFDLVVGNPPWITWDRLPREYRKRTEPLWRHYGLFSLSGTAARHGGGKKELATLVLCTAADRFLKQGGRLSMVLPQNVFQTAGAGEGFRHFRLGATGAPLRVLRVDDWTACRPFSGPSHHVATVVLEKGTPTRYPVPYFRWFSQETDRNTSRAPAEQQPPAVECVVFEAVPVCADRADSPWMVGPPGQVEHLRSLLGPSHYRAYLGANTAGANGVYWVEVLDRVGPHVLIRNLARCSKRPVRQVEALVEPDLLYPLVRWGDVDRFAARSTAYIVMAQDPQSRTGIEPDRMRRRFPKTLAYLERFESLLTRRAAYRRYQQRGAFYSMYNVGQPTFSSWKVVWRRMDRHIRAAVLEPVDDRLLGIRPAIPQETCVLVPVASPAEAHYLCAVLNSTLIDTLVRAQSVLGSKGFASAGVLARLGIGAFDAENRLHRQLAKLGRLAQQQRGSGKEGGTILAEIDSAVAELRGVPLALAARLSGALY